MIKIVKIVLLEVQNITKLSKEEWLEMVEILFFGIAINGIYGLFNSFSFKGVAITFFSIYGTLKAKKVRKEL